MHHLGLCNISSCLRRSSRAGYAQLSIVVNSPPYGGHVAASPAAGTAALDAFVLEALDWTDDADDLPLTFSFSYFNGKVSVEWQFAASFGPVCCPQFH